MGKWRSRIAICRVARFHRFWRCPAFRYGRCWGTRGGVVRAARRLLVVFLLVASAASAADHAVASTAGFGSAVSGRPLLTWMPEQFGTGHSYTHDQAIAAAQRYDVIVAFPKAFQAYVADMRAANPNLVLIAYSNGMFVTPKQGPTSGAFPQS